MSGHHPPCPQCNSGSYEPGRSLTMHLQRYCRGASSTKSMKHSHDDFSTMSCRPTLLQQAIQFNNNSDSLFCLPTISNTLHRAPGLPTYDTLDESVHSDVYDNEFPPLMILLRPPLMTMSIPLLVINHLSTTCLVMNSPVIFRLPSMMFLWKIMSNCVHFDVMKSSSRPTFFFRSSFFLKCQDIVVTT